jgi:glucosamine--fructose-6-phosphate aminotransferase (isomerizing)
MCGIIGIIGVSDVAERIVSGLKHLEYRGYDSAGVAAVHDGVIDRCRAEGKIVNLKNKLSKGPLNGRIGIGHTRWATHGAPNTINAHPHATNKVAVVHNGIIENFSELREELEKKGHKFTTDTDTEVVPHLITEYLNSGSKPVDAVKKAIKHLEGAFALGIIFADEEIMIAARKGSPLAIGFGKKETYLASDAIALAPLTSKLCYLEDGDIAVITDDGVKITDEKGKATERAIVKSSAKNIAVGKENYAHFMLKEIYEQPGVIGETLNAYYNPVSGEIQLPDMTFSLGDVPKVTIVACGTSYYAGLTAKYWLEKIARVPVEIDVASEFRYREAIMPENGVALFISQSGETADTLAALKYAKKQKQKIISLVNVPESSMARAADVVLRTYAGPEIGVASTKAFTTQLVALACFTLAIAGEKGTIKPKDIVKLAHALSEIPARAAEVLNHDEAIEELAHDLLKAQDILYIGRGTSYAIAQEGALKLKEISYIHAEATAAGELKHGPIALIDKDVPIIVIAPSDDLYDKTASNAQEVAARGGKIVLLSDKKGIKPLKKVSYATIELPEANDFVTPILYAIPVQLLAYHVAVLKGTDVDQPRNLAKSVTVE